MRKLYALGQTRTDDLLISAIISNKATMITVRRFLQPIKVPAKLRGHINPE